MNRRFAVYTQETECLDCYKCLRQCPSKAIVVRGTHASIDPDLCIACGHCVAVCPSNAKKIRNDISRVRAMFSASERVYVCVAPSWKSEFRDISDSALISTLKKMGFAGVAEAALGAQDVSKHTAQIMREKGEGIYLSSACPAAVDYVKQHFPALASTITQVASPAIVTANILKERFGEDVKVVFLGPCTAKKNEADTYQGYVDLSLTFKEFREWLESDEITFSDDNTEVYDLPVAEEGILYPIEGGMIETVKPYLEGMDVDMVAVSGLEKIAGLLKSIEEESIEGTVFIETLACNGGCLGGAGMVEGKAGLKSILDIYRSAQVRSNCLERKGNSVVEIEFKPDHNEIPELSAESLSQTLRMIGKESLEDELNCGGCGYNTCREFAQALAADRAETSMCVSYMRRLAQKKANALLRSMPSGVVIVNETLEIIESNISFARLFGEDTENAFEVIPGLKGARLDSILPFSIFFSTALRTGEDIRREHLECQGRLFNVNIFVIEKEKVVGAVIEDVTNKEIKREQIARRAREVIQKNIATVQEIACLLGEHVTDTEVLLSNIADDYSEDYDKTLPENK